MIKLAQRLLLLKSVGSNCVWHEDLKYNAVDLIMETRKQKLKAFELQVDLFYRDFPIYPIEDMDNLINYIAQVMQADLDYPIILSPSNSILDGHHRFARSVLEGRETIKAVKFPKMPRYMGLETETED